MIVLSGAGSTVVADESGDATDEDATVVVTADSPPRQAGSEDRFDRRTIDAIGASSAQDVLRSLSGLQLSQHGSEGKAAQFFLRGFDAAHGTDFTVGIDGLSLNEPSHIHGHGYADSGLVIPEAVRGVELRKGPYSLDQGNLSTAGDVQYRLGVPESRRGTAAGVEGGWPARGRIWGYHAPREGSDRDVVAGEIVVDRGPYTNRGTRRGGGVGQQEFGDWVVRGGLQAAQFGLPGALRLASIEAGELKRSDSLTPETTGESAQVWAGAIRHFETGEWTHRSSLDLRGRYFEANENFTGYLIDEQRGDERREFQRGIAGVATHRATRNLGENWRLVGEFETSVDRFHHLADLVDEAGDAYDRTRGGVGWQTSAAVAPGIEGFATDWLQLHGGVRLEAIATQYRDDELVGGAEGFDLAAVAAPRGRATVYVGDAWSVVGAIGRGFRGPEAPSVVERDEERFESRRAGAETAHEITTIDGGELGVIFAPVAELELSATAFGHYSRAEFVYDHVSRRDVDLGATRRLGGELAGVGSVADWFSLRGHVSAVDARFVDDGDRIPFIPPVEAGILGFGEWNHGLFGGVQWRGVAGRPLPFDARSAGWHTTDLHAGWRIDGWEVRLDVNNLFGASFDEGVYHYASDFEKTGTSIPSIHVVPGNPRMFRIGVSHRW